MEEGRPAGLTRVKIRADSMELAALVLQDLAAFLSVSELEAEVDFPDELTEFEEVTRPSP